MPVWVRVGTALMVSTIILSKPLLNGLGVQSTDAVMSAKLVMNFSFFAPLFVGVLAVAYSYFHVVERSHFVLFCIDVAGIPGTFLGLFVLAAR